MQSLELFTCKTRDGIKSLVHSGAKVDTRDSDQATPLIAHARQDHLDIIKELLRLRANVDLQDSKGYSALIIAAEVGNLEMVQVLVANGAILDLKERKVSMGGREGREREGGRGEGGRKIREGKE